ncbi:MAG: glycosyltransferase [Alphaproteobacteria bacterium]|nr:glycosyltransferase [Alphaproteobacteria bacterium]
MTGKMPKIAVLIPVYNTERYLPMCLDSVIGQTYARFEVLCLNDGSTDKSPEILEQYAARDKRFRIFSQPNAGVTAALNALLDKVPGDTDYIFYLDSDDFIHPRAFECLLHHMRRRRPDVVECATARVGHDAAPHAFPDIRIPHPGCVSVDDMDVFFSRRTRVGAWINKVNKLYDWRRVKSVRFRTELLYEEDYFYACEINAVIRRKVIVPDVLYFYRRNPASLNGRLNFPKYLASGINRIRLSHEVFVKTGRIPPEYRSDFKADLARDAYRMIVKKNLKKNKNDAECRALFHRAADAVDALTRQGIVSFATLPFSQRLVVRLCRRRMYRLAKIAARLP